MNEAAYRNIAAPGLPGPSIEEQATRMQVEALCSLPLELMALRTVLEGLQAVLMVGLMIFTVMGVAALTMAWMALWA